MNKIKKMKKFIFIISLNYDSSSHAQCSIIGQSIGIEKDWKGNFFMFILIF